MIESDFITGASKPLTKNLDFSLYINTKILYTTIRTYEMIEDVVQDIQYQQCLTNQEILKNKLYLSAQHPEMAGILTGSVEGHYGRVMGEVLYVIQCPVVPVLPRSSDKCYQEIPVFVNGKRRFLKPLTRIIVAVPTLVDCIPTLTVRFKAHEKWWMRTPTILQAQTPRILDPSISNYQMAPEFIFDVGHKGSE